MSIEFSESTEVSGSNVKKTRTLKVGRIVFIAIVVMVIALGCLLQPRIKDFWVSGGGIEVKAGMVTPPASK